MKKLRQIWDEMGDSYTLEEKISVWLKQKQQELEPDIPPYSQIGQAVEEGKGEVFKELLEDLEEK